MNSITEGLKDCFVGTFDEPNIVKRVKTAFDAIESRIELSAEFSLESAGKQSRRRPTDDLLEADGREGVFSGFGDVDLSVPVVVI